MVVSTKIKDVMNTEMHFSTPIYTIEKPEFLKSAIFENIIKTNNFIPK